MEESKKLTPEIIIQWKYDVRVLTFQQNQLVKRQRGMQNKGEAEVSLIMTPIHMGWTLWDSKTINWPMKLSKVKENILHYRKEGGRRTG
jgi:hypothetical protein